MLSKWEQVKVVFWCYEKESWVVFYVGANLPVPGVLRRAFIDMRKRMYNLTFWMLQSDPGWAVSQKLKLIPALAFWESEHIPLS